jgi:hypothetical protein
MILFEGLFIALAVMTVYALIEDNRNRKPKSKPMATRRKETKK